MGKKNRNTGGCADKLRWRAARAANQNIRCAHGSATGCRGLVLLGPDLDRARAVPAGPDTALLDTGCAALCRACDDGTLFLRLFGFAGIEAAFARRSGHAAVAP
ncbi:hypothetical protein [Amycolatopsis sp. NPDC004079]|uniref:hypothetical protein n=1 Tax=Amycolatopsis sp. NPDC004079 TaxID=3154549 RepID=UPI0033BB7E2B